MYVKDQKKVRTNSSAARGFGIIELMIALGILASAISVAMFMVQQSKSSQSLNGFMLRMQSVRYSLTMAIQNDQAWTATVNSAGNFSFKCIRDLSSCRNAGGSFDLLDPTGLKDIYDGRSPTSGFAPDGTLCSTFDSPVRNPKCPLHLNLSWSPICPPAPDLCLNPTVQINGDFVYSSSNKGTSMNWKMFAFEFLRQKIFCAADPVPFNLSIESGPVTTSPNSVTSTSTAMIYPAGAGLSTIMESCGLGTTIFQYPNAYTGGAVVSDAANQASVCFIAKGQPPASAPCLFEWYVSKEQWVLRSNGAVVYTALAGESGDQTAEYSFTMHNGQMTFYYGGQRRFVFPTLYGFELQALFRPGSSVYSTGFNNVTFLYQ